jgi:SagB-type dehydrogenase family enzyme
MSQAHQLSQHLSADPQVQLPRYPRLSEELQIIWHSGQLALITGAASDVILRGKSVRVLLPQLLPLLNGTLTVAAICERLPHCKPSVVQDALLLLYMQGVLEDGQAARQDLSPDLQRAFAGQLKFYSRYVDVTRANPSRYAVLKQLQASALLLIGEERIAAPLIGELADLGVGAITWQPLAPVAAQPGFTWTDISMLVPTNDDRAIAAQAAEWLAGTPNGLVVLVGRQERPVLLNALNQQVVRQNARLLRGLIRPDLVELGPTVFGGESSCYACATLNGLLPASPDEQPAPPASPLSHIEQIGISQTALLVLSLTTQLTSIKSGDTLLRLDLDTLAWEPTQNYRIVGCPVCGVEYSAGRDLLIGAEYQENLPAFYHINTNERSYLIYPKGHQQHYSAKNAVAMISAAKSYTNCAQIDLTALVAQAPSSTNALYGRLLPPANPSAELADLAWLLLASCGRSFNDPAAGWQVGQRLTPSGGNLASQTLYVVNQGIAGLERGLYHFNPQRGSLEVRQQADLRPAIDRLIVGELPPDAEVLAVVIETAALGRVESKYAYKAYRYSLYDAGSLLQSLASVGATLGWEVLVTADFDDEALRDVLQLHSVNETPLLISYLVRAASPAAQEVLQ